MISKLQKVLTEMCKPMEFFALFQDLKKKMFDTKANTSTDANRSSTTATRHRSANMYSEKSTRDNTVDIDDIESNRMTVADKSVNKTKVYATGPQSYRFTSWIRELICDKFLFTIYIIVKLIYLINCFCQLLFLNKLITSDLSSIQSKFNTNRMDNQQTNFVAKSTVWSGFEFGYRAIVNLVQTGSLFGMNNQPSKMLIFHSVIFCDFKIRMLGDRLHKHTVQCVAPINIFTEKLFTLLWFWLFILCFINLFNLLDWLRFYVFARARFSFMQGFLIRKKTTTKQPGQYQHSRQPPPPSEELLNAYINDKQFIKKLIRKYLKVDNLFVYRIISKNSNQLITQELVTLIIEYYINKNSFLNQDNTAIL